MSRVTVVPGHPATFATWTCSAVRNYSTNDSVLHGLGMDFNLKKRIADSVNDYLVYIFFQAETLIGQHTSYDDKKEKYNKVWA